MNRELSADSTLAHYRIISKIGAGGMGVVYLAQDSKLDRKVALKVLPPDVASNQDRMNRFVREAKSAAALNHPNIAHIHGLEESAGVRALVMEFVDGEDLSALIARGPMGFDDALPVAKQIAEALEAAHEQGIVHRDLKPANVKIRDGFRCSGAKRKSWPRSTIRTSPTSTGWRMPTAPLPW